MTRTGRALAYLVIMLGFLMWSVAGETEGRKQIVVVTLAIAAGSYVLGSGIERVRERRAAANREEK